LQLENNCVAENKKQLYEENHLNAFKINFFHKGMKDRLTNDENMSINTTINKRQK
jgi:hypothetical protein